MRAKTAIKHSCFLIVDAQILKAVARITNVNFTEALLNPNSEEYKMFIEKVRHEVQTVSVENRSLCTIIELLESLR